MPGILTQPNLRRLEALNRVRHVLQGEEGSISLLKRDSTNTLVELALIESGWTYSDRDKDGLNLPHWVTYELQVAEDLIAREDRDQIAAIQHGQKRFRIVERSDGKPGIWEPEGFNRFWRFYLSPLEEIP